MIDCHRLWVIRACSAQWHALKGSCVTPTMTGAVQIERGGDPSNTFDHGNFRGKTPSSGVGNRCHFGTMRTILTVTLDKTSQRHHNQPATALVWAETAGGLCVGFVFRRGESMILCCGEGGRQQRPFWHHTDNFDRSA